MGEYVKFKNGDALKLGTCDRMYYITHTQAVALAASGKLTDVACDHTPASLERMTRTKGLIWRFPWPWDDGQALEGREPEPFDYQHWPAVLSLGVEVMHRQCRASVSANGTYNINVSFPCPMSEEGKTLDTSPRPNGLPAYLIGEMLRDDGQLMTVFECIYCGAHFVLSPEEHELEHPGGLHHEKVWPRVRPDLPRKPARCSECHGEPIEDPRGLLGTTTCGACAGTGVAS